MFPAKAVLCQILKDRKLKRIPDTEIRTCQLSPFLRILFPPKSVKTGCEK